MILGITGGIATGKTAVSNILKEMNFEIIDTDIISREVIKLPKIIQSIQNEFGSSVINNGAVDRRLLREVIFNDKEKVKKLNNIMHPTIIEKTKFEINRLQTSKKPVIVVIPLLFETNLEYLVDSILLITADYDKQIERIMKRDNSTKINAENIIASQMPLGEKIKRSNYVIENNGTYDELKEKVLIFLKTLNYTGVNKWKNL